MANKTPKKTTFARITENIGKYPLSLGVKWIAKLPAGVHVPLIVVD